MMRRRQRVHFVYADRLARSGSTVMRGEQLSSLAARSLGRSASVQYSSLKQVFTRSTLFLTKGALKELTPQRGEELRAAGNRLLFDVVDEVVPPAIEHLPDALIASSMTAFDALSRQYPQLEVLLVNHHVDPRVQALGIERGSQSFSAGYFGESINAVLPAAVRSRIDVVELDTSRENAPWFDRLRDHSLHYAVRNTRELDAYKPFLKGFTAAWCWSNVLIQDSQAEAIRWLGDDYPFLVHLSDDTDQAAVERTVLEALDSARQEFGSPIWEEGLDRMAGIRDRTSEHRIAREIRAALTS